MAKRIASQHRSAAAGLGVVGEVGERSWGDLGENEKEGGEERHNTNKYTQACLMGLKRRATRISKFCNRRESRSRSSVKL